MIGKDFIRRIIVAAAHKRPVVKDCNTGNNKEIEIEFEIPDSVQQISPYVVVEQGRDKKIKIRRLKGRLKLVIIFSPVDPRNRFSGHLIKTIYVKEVPTKRV